MIFGHYFYFQSDPSIFKHALSPLSMDNNNAIQVIEEPEFPCADIFPLAREWFSASGQNARYLVNTYHRVNRNEKYSWAFEIKGVVTLIWDASDKKIIYIRGKNYTHERLRFWVFHTFFPIVLELERIYRILHVGSVEIKGKPVLFSAFSYGGKSTLTDYFIKQGHTMLSDDSLAIEKRGEIYYAIASYPFHRPYRELETLGYHVENFATEPKPLHAVYLLEKSEPDAHVEIIELKGIEKFKAFHYSSFIDFDFMKKERFEFFTEMAKHVPVYKVKVPWDLERLGEVYETIVSMNTER